MKAILALLLLTSTLFATPADVTLACDVQAGVTAVRFYERMGTAAPYTYALRTEVAVAAAGAVTTVVAVPDDGVPHAYIARSLIGSSTPLPATTVTVVEESPDSAPVLVTVKKGATAGPTAFRVTNVLLR